MAITRGCPSQGLRISSDTGEVVGSCPAGVRNEFCFHFLSPKELRLRWFPQDLGELGF